MWTRAATSASATRIREDGAYVEAGENDNLIVQKIEANPNAVGIFGYSFLEENEDKLVGSIVEGESPTFEAIASGKYPASRPLFIYVKKAHLERDPGPEGIRRRVRERQGARARKAISPTRG